MSTIYHDQPTIILSWLSTIHDTEITGNPRPSYFNTSSTVPRAPASWPPNSTRRHVRSTSIRSTPNPDRTSSAVLNTGYRSTWELLKALPAPADTMKVLPTLPTHYFTLSELDIQLPDPVHRPLPLTIFLSGSPIAAEAEYSRVLDLRECLRVEEITIELKADMERLYLDPPSYHASQTRLGDVRILLMRACQSLSYIQDECAAHGLNLDVASIDKRRAANRPGGHPFNMIVPYLKDDAINDFHNFEAFTDPIRLNAGDKPRNLGSRLNLPESNCRENGVGSDGSDSSEDTSDSSVDFRVYNYEILSDADKQTESDKQMKIDTSFGPYVRVWDFEATEDY